MRLVRLTAAAAAMVCAVSILVAAPTGANIAASPPTTWNCSSARLGLDEVRVEFAPVVSTERAPDGGPIVPKPARGAWVPVIVVHGWTSRATHPDADGTEATQGAFSHLIDLTANRLGKAEVPRSLVGQLQDLPGAAVFTFDYHPYSGRWVSDAHIGPGLGKVIDCLAAASGQKVIVVGHSMGGLAARYAAAQPGRTSSISRVITLGTPNLGSLAALLTAAGIEAGSALSQQLAVLRLILSMCGQETTSSIAPGGLCDTLPTAVSSFDGGAGRALRAGSAELAALKPVPAEIPVNALAGDATFMVPLGWFSMQTTPLTVGDLIVTRGSAVYGARTTKSISCRYQLNAIRGSADTVGLWVGLAAKNEVAAQPLGSFSGACFHTNLMRSIELTNEVVGLVNDDINPTLTDSALLNSPIPVGTCGIDGGFGWYNPSPIALLRGSGISRNPDGTFAGSSIIDSSVVGRADFTGDGQPEVVLRLRCSGSPPDQCCAGRSSVLNFVGVFEIDRDKSLKRVGPAIYGGLSLPGDQYGPAQRGISAVSLRGGKIVTTEYIIYGDSYTPEQVGGDPTRDVAVIYTLKEGKWVSS